MFKSLYTTIVVLALLVICAADHIDAPITWADNNVDINDLYAFTNKDDKLVLILTVHPFADSSSRLNPDYLYQFKIDTTGDHIEDFVIQTIAQNTGTHQSINIYGPGTPAVKGTQANEVLRTNPLLTTFGETAQSDKIKAVVAVKDDPFFFDLSRYNEIIANVKAGNAPPTVSFASSPTSDTLAKTNVIAIVVEFPKSLLGDVSKLSIWATSSLRR